MLFDFASPYRVRSGPLPCGSRCLVLDQSSWKVRTISCATPLRRVSRCSAQINTMNAYLHHSSRVRFSILALTLRAAWVGALAFVAAALHAQTSAPGSIAGTVSNVATGANLEGAEVTLQPGNTMVLTSREGRFVIPQVAPGSYVLSATYSGLDVGKVYVQVGPGANLRQDIGLSSGVY